MSLVLFAWLFGSFAFLAGWATRWTGSLLAVVLAYVFFLDQQFYSNHQVLLIAHLVYLVFANAGAEWSMDRRGRGLPPSDADSRPSPCVNPDVNPWAARLLQTQLTAVYLFAGLSKLNPVFLSGAVLAVYLPHEGWLAWPSAWRTREILQPLALATVLGEVALAGALWSRGLRALAALGGVLLHLGMFALLDRSQTLGILSFALTCLSVYFLWWVREKDPSPLPCPLSAREAISYPGG
jgi:hypothetical protein